MKLGVPLSVFSPPTPGYLSPPTPPSPLGLKRRGASAGSSEGRGAELRGEEWSWSHPYDDWTDGRTDGQTCGLRALAPIFYIPALLWALQPTRLLIFPGFRASALCHASNWSMNTTLQGMCRPCGNPQTPQGLRKGPDTTWLQVRDPTEAQRSMRGRGRVSCTQNSHHTLPGRYPRLPPMPQCSAWHRGPQIPTYSTRALQTHLEDPMQGARQ